MPPKAETNANAPTPSASARVTALRLIFEDGQGGQQPDVMPNEAEDDESVVNLVTLQAKYIDGC
jgi:hypothetical protein